MAKNRRRAGSWDVGRGASAYPDVSQRFRERDKVIKREKARRASLPSPESINPNLLSLGNTALPFHKQSQAFYDTVRDSKVTVLSGETGSGKSTQSWKEGLALGMDVVVVVPRRMIADNLYSRAVEELEEMGKGTLGRDICAKHHSDETIMPPNRKRPLVRFMTAGSFSKMLHSQSEAFQRPTMFVCDEVHEANYEVDIAMALAARHVDERDDCRLVLSSATHSIDQYEKKYEDINGGALGKVYVEGRPFGPIDIGECPDENLAEAYCREGIEHERSLLFTSGKAEIDDVINELERKLPKGQRAIIKKLHAKTTQYELDHLTSDVASGERLVIVATPAAMSGVTIPGVTCVMSDGMVKRAELGEENARSLRKTYASRSEEVQKAGRGGRTQDGAIYRLVRPMGGTDAFVGLDSDERPESAPAEIYNRTLSRVVLEHIVAGDPFIDLNRKYLAHAVEPRSILIAEELINRLGASQDEDGSEIPTNLGRRMDKYPLRPEYARMLEYGRDNRYAANTMAHLAIALCSMEAGGLAYFAHDAGEEWRKCKSAETTDDYAMQVDMFTTHNLHTYEASIDPQALQLHDIDHKNAQTAHKQVRRVMGVMGINLSVLHNLEPLSGTEKTLFYTALLSGMIDSVYKKSGRAKGGVVTYENILSGDDATPRTMSNRTTVEASPELVIATPRQYYKTVRQVVDGVAHEKPVPHHIIEDIVPVQSQTDLESHISHLMQHKPTSDFVLDTNSAITQQVERRYGVLSFGTTQRQVVELSNKAKEFAFDVIISGNNNIIQELKDTKRTMEKLYQRATREDREKIYATRHQWDDAYIRKIVMEAIETTSSVGEAYARLGDLYFTSSRAGIMSDEAKLRIVEGAPDRITTGGIDLAICYHEGTPYCVADTVRDRSVLTDHVYIPDGREVMFRVKDDRKKYYLTAEEFKQYKQQ